MHITQLLGAQVEELREAWCYYQESCVMRWQVAGMRTCARRMRYCRVSCTGP